MSIHISELNIYPVKSCRGFRVSSAIVTKRGFTRYDHVEPDDRGRQQQMHNPAGKAVDGTDSASGAGQQHERTSA